MEGENFGEFGELQDIRQDFLVSKIANQKLCGIHKCEKVWMALLKHFQLKNQKQPLPDPNEALSIKILVQRFLMPTRV